MSLILRIDVDKSYGRSTFIQKVASKIAENYWLPSIPAMGYLHDLKAFLLFLSEESIPAHIYFRKCSLPPKIWFAGTLLKGHKFGLHAEDTRTFDTFKKELDNVQAHFGSERISSFTKHGSGSWKSGRKHFPPYEPEKYCKWAELSGVPFLSGNLEDMNAPAIPNGNHHFYPGAFWIDRPYTKYDDNSLQKVLDSAKERSVFVLIHCADFLAIDKVSKGIRKLVSMSKEQNVPWITL